ncbi:Hypothetical predicted protein [Mytilus galloprovincialis]|uniref:Uncharacterized protein n=1 Tax=Mytilus galloprovincialis TaxID=29158 RepID=A0A8B6CHU9_MYTGA|nr:Hypothetical predicted protein [Mytilus galloprovincialis]
MHTHSTTIHWHGLHQKSSPWSDGVAFVTQCPILSGQSYTYKFNAKPLGTSFYHPHNGDQRTMGLYGLLIVIPTPGQTVVLPQEGDNVFVAIMQDWNHDDDENALYQQMLWDDFDISDEVNSDEVVEIFFNFAFPGENGNTPGSVNGHQFLPPKVAAYAQPDLVDYNCDACSAYTICECTYAVTIDNDNKDRVYQLVISSIGRGANWSHPVHLHGHSFYVMKMVFATYDSESQLVPNGGQDTIDISCTDSNNFCSDAKWKNASWENGRHPDLNWHNPPQKDTIIIPSGGYVIIRFKADSPGVCFFHCHIDLHNTNGMGMIINESPNSQPKVPNNFPKCNSFENDGKHILTYKLSYIANVFASV